MKYDLIQGNYMSTLMGSIKGLVDYYQAVDLSDTMLFGITGHAFMINFSKGVGPCAPYLWDMTSFESQCKDYLGVNIFEEEGFVLAKSELEDKKKVIEDIKKRLDEGKIVFMSSLEYQLIIGYDEEKLITTIPWENAPSVAYDMKIETLEGLHEFMTYFSTSKSNRLDVKEGVAKSIHLAIQLQENPPKMKNTACGKDAIDFLLSELTEENAKGHGLWWSSMVWMESRKYASSYMLEIKPFFEKDEVLDALSLIYTTSSELLYKISNREVSKEEKLPWIYELKKNEDKALPLLKQLI